ncbi:Rrf2 family transcriptional regulator [bacterium]|nr:MAG: Rrf2 family transcriptional regulator [bacterium]
MRIANRFAIAVHIISLLETDENGEATSEWMAGSIGTNPVIVRRISGMLRRAGLLRTRQGVAGAEIERPLSEITLLDVYRAVNEEGELFSVHPRPNPLCEVGANIQDTLEEVFGEAQEAMENRLKGTTMLDVVQDLRVRAREKESAGV